MQEFHNEDQVFPLYFLTIFFSETSGNEWQATHRDGRHV